MTIKDLFDPAKDIYRGSRKSSPTATPRKTG
jgi:hypothetical protein